MLFGRQTEKIDRFKLEYEEKEEKEKEKEELQMKQAKLEVVRK